MNKFKNLFHKHIWVEWTNSYYTGIPIKYEYCSICGKIKEVPRKVKSVKKI